MTMTPLGFGLICSVTPFRLSLSSQFPWYFTLISDSAAGKFFLAFTTVAFGRDMLLDIPFAADFIALRNARQLKIDQRLLAANSSRRPKEFKVNDNVYVRHHTAQSKLDDMWEGPFKIVTVHTNGNVTVERPNGIHQRIHIRHIKP